MKKHANILSLVMAVLMIAALFCGCGSEPEKTEAPADTQNVTMSEPETVPEKTEAPGNTQEETISEDEAKAIEALAGTWYTTVSEDESVAQTMLEHFDFYPEEIACVDLTTAKTVKAVKFTTDKTYQYAYDADGTRACVRAFFEGAFSAMYEKRASLGQLYGLDFEPADKEEFQQVYAEFYGVANFAELLDNMVDNCFDYEALCAPHEEGTYNASSDVMDMTVLGETIPRILKYSIEGDTLTLIYADGDELYSRSK